MKPSKLIENGASGLDLLIERDAGNDIRILTGKTEHSKNFWHALLNKSEEALCKIRKEPIVINGDVSMTKKKVELKPNTVGGYDLFTERDSGNAALILTGKKENSRKFWKDIKKTSEKAIVELSERLKEEDENVLGK